MGGSSVISGGEVSKDFDLTGIPHTDVKVVLDYYAIDSWDSEWAYVSASGSNVNKVWNRHIDDEDPGRLDTCGYSWADGVYHIELTGTHTGDTVTVTAGSTLDQAASDESFGIDNVEIWVK